MQEVFRHPTWWTDTAEVTTNWADAVGLETQAQGQQTAAPEALWCDQRLWSTFLVFSSVSAN
jgi:hypothetical protein